MYNRTVSLPCMFNVQHAVVALLVYDTATFSNDLKYAPHVSCPLYLPHHCNARRTTAMLLSYKNGWSSSKGRHRDVLPCPRMCRGTCFSSFGPVQVYARAARWNQTCYTPASCVLQCTDSGGPLLKPEVWDLLLGNGDSPL